MYSQTTGEFQYDSGDAGGYHNPFQEPALDLFTHKQIRIPGYASLARR
jgi:hypothetical protein